MKRIAIAVIILMVLICGLVYGATYLDWLHSAVTAKFGTLTVDTTATIAGLKKTVNVVDYVTTATVRTVTAAESGTTFIVSDLEGISSSTVSFQLPAAAAGLTYTFVDGEASADQDLRITAATGDTINGGTAGKKYMSGGDTVKESTTLVAIDGTRWEVIKETGTWANDNS